MEDESHTETMLTSPNFVVSRSNSKGRPFKSVLSSGIVYAVQVCYNFLSLGIKSLRLRVIIVK